MIKLKFQHKTKIMKTSTVDKQINLYFHWYCLHIDRFIIKWSDPNEMDYLLRSNEILKTFEAKNRKSLIQLERENVFFFFLWNLRSSN